MNFYDVLFRRSTQSSEGSSSSSSGEWQDVSQYISINGEEKPTINNIIAISNGQLVFIRINGTGIIPEVFSIQTSNLINIQGKNVPLILAISIENGFYLAEELVNYETNIWEYSNQVKIEDNQSWYLQTSYYL